MKITIAKVAAAAVLIASGAFGASPASAAPAWSPLGGGVYTEAPFDDNFGGGARAIAQDGAGNVYAGGHFTKAGGVPANHVAKWDGSSWSALGSGVPATVSTLAVGSNGHVYANGDEDLRGIWEWDGTTWTRIGYASGPVRQLTIDPSGALIAAGEFSFIGDAAMPGIARYSGGSWQAFDARITYPMIKSVAFDKAGNLFVAGTFGVGPVDPNPNFGQVSKWDGTTWTSLPVPAPYGAPNALAVDDSGTLYVAAEKAVYRWNGSWTTIGVPDFDAGSYKAIAVDPLQRVHVTGEFTTIGGVAANRYAIWNGSTWTAPDSGLNVMGWSLSIGGGRAYVGGDFTTAGGVSAHHIASYTLPVAPSVTKVAPTFGPTTGGTTVTITGTGFTGATQVTFGGAPSSTFTVTSETTIVAEAPAHAAGGVAVSVTTPVGTGSLANAFAYKVYVKPVQPPKITGQLLVGKIVSVTKGIWTPGNATLSYQWVRYSKGKAVNIVGATKSTLTLTKLVKGQVIGVTVTAKAPGAVTYVGTVKAAGVVK